MNSPLKLHRDEWKSLLQNIDRNDELRFQKRQGPQWGWNYPDALFVGKAQWEIDSFFVSAF